MITYMELQPAKAKAKKPDNLWDDPTWIAEPKLDGWRFLMHFGSKLDRTYMSGRRISSKTGLYSEKGLCAKPLWPNFVGQLGYTVLDGEIMSPKGFNDIAGIMNVAPEKAAKRIEEIGPPTYTVFDALFMDGQDLREWPQLERRIMLQTIIPLLGNPLITLINSINEQKLKQYEEHVRMGGEGVVLKEVFAPYGEGWVKVKRFSTLDVVVTGFKEGKGKYIGQVGALRVSVIGTSGQMLEVGSVSGMNDEERMLMTNEPEKYLGTVVEIDAQGFGKERLRHPRFRRHRPDANPACATLQKMQEELSSSTDPSSAQQQLSLF